MTSGADHTDRDIALAYLDALGGDDPAYVVALVADDFCNEHHAELGSGCVGRAEYAQRLPGFFAAFAQRSYTIAEVAVAPSEATDGASDVIVNYRFGADVDGTTIDIPGVMWITVADGSVVRRLDCWDSLTFHRQTGTQPG